MYELSNKFENSNATISRESWKRLRCFLISRQVDYFSIHSSHSLSQFTLTKINAVRALLCQVFRLIRERRKHIHSYEVSFMWWLAKASSFIAVKEERSEHRCSDAWSTAIHARQWICSSRFEICDKFNEMSRQSFISWIYADEQYRTYWSNARTQTDESRLQISKSSSEQLRYSSHYEFWRAHCSFWSSSLTER